MSARTMVSDVVTEGESQSARAIMMVRPQFFAMNADTARDNPYQQKVSSPMAASVAAMALCEFDTAVSSLEEAGVTLYVFEDHETPTPDSVFPNNWLSTHPDGRVVLYPLLSPLRRLERRRDIVARLARHYEVREVVDLTHHEQRGHYLEGTGALVLDHVDRVAYVGISNRASPEIALAFAREFDFEPMIFHTMGPSGMPVYHTNVVLCIGTEFALVALEMIQREMRDAVRRRLVRSGRDVIELSPDQVAGFAGNAIELQGASSRFTVLSARAKSCLRSDQLRRISASCEILSLDVPTIELSGGSVRCMMTAIRLPRKAVASRIDEFAEGANGMEPLNP